MMYPLVCVYLHNHNPPIIHQNLTPHGVLLTAHPVAKISNLVVTKLIKAKYVVTAEKDLDLDGFMPPEALVHSSSVWPSHGHIFICWNNSSHF